MRELEKNYEIVVVGGGMAGLCAAIAAAREGSSVALVHNRPVLGGNASSEIRMHIVGADYHGTRPNARETGILEEILLEHKHRNPENSWAIFDSILWEKAAFQENLSLYLNTHISEVVMDSQRIAAVCGIQQNTETRFCFHAKVFVDATGDAMLAALAGADTVIGREGKDVYREPHAPEHSDHYTMGSSLMLKARDMGHPVPFIRPFWAKTYTEEDMQNRAHEEISSGYWWIELGGGEQRVIEETIQKAYQCAAAAPATPVKDTIKFVCDGAVESTPQRDRLVAVQTPQVFDAELLKAALQSAVEQGVEVTDDCSAVERLGKKVYLVQGSYENLKITTPVDLLLAEKILELRGEMF